MLREEAIEFIEQVGTDLDFIDIELVVNKIYDEHEAQLKQAYIDGSNSCNELIQSLYKQIEQLKDKQ